MDRKAGAWSAPEPSTRAEVGARLGLHSVAGQTTDGHRTYPMPCAAAPRSSTTRRGRQLGLDPSQHPTVTFIPVADTGNSAAAWPQLLRTSGQADVGHGRPGPTVRALQPPARRDLQGLGRKTVSSTPSASVRGPGVQAGQRHPRAGDTATVCWPEMVEAGVEELVIEVSSQALGERRLCGTDLDAARADEM